MALKTFDFDPDVTRREDPAYWAASCVIALRSKDTARAAHAQRQLARLGVNAKFTKVAKPRQAAKPNAGFDSDVTRREGPGYWAASWVIALRSKDTARAAHAQRQLARLGVNAKFTKVAKSRQAGKPNAGEVTNAH
jgi:hypothetical protein